MAMTIRDIAREAGVSTATVSRALRGLPNVDPVTRTRVMGVAERLDYVISPTASRLATGRTGAIAVITPFVARWYFATVLSGAERILKQSDLDLLLFSTGDPSEPHRVPPHRKLRRRVDGFLVIALDADSPDVAGLFEFDLPVTLIGTTHPGVSSVQIDDEQGARTATQHLINLGHERIAIISGRPLPSPFTPERDRYAGYLDALLGAGLQVDPALVTYGSFTIDGGESAMSALLSQPRPPTAVFAISDEMAFGAMRALRRHGLTPGQEVSIVGYDGHELADLLELTTVVQPVERLGARSARLLMDQLDRPGAPTRLIRLGTELVVRGSSGPPRGHAASRRRLRGT
jgi:LacI family transcriptional regulator, repressor for deo operon, udp, cdd, tsx, nupC, and nupG